MDMLAIFLIKNPEYVYFVAFVTGKPFVHCLTRNEWNRKLKIKVEGDGEISTRSKLILNIFRDAITVYIYVVIVALAASR